MKTPPPQSQSSQNVTTGFVCRRGRSLTPGASGVSEVVAFGGRRARRERRPLHLGVGAAVCPERLSVKAHSAALLDLCGKCSVLCPGTDGVTGSWGVWEQHQALAPPVDRPPRSEHGLLRRPRGAGQQEPLT